MLEIKNLKIEYNRIILKNVNVIFPRAKVSLIRGESGSGKSSLLNIIGLIQKPNKECVYSLDKKLVDFNNEEEKANYRLTKVGFVFQQNNLLQKLTVIENIMLPMRILNDDESKIKDEAKKLIEFVGLSDVADRYPADLSGGEEQRVAIARALINNADIILADEPTASLDNKNSDNILELFKKLAHDLNKIVIIVSHDNKLLEVADDVYEIEEGALIKTKTSEIISLDNVINDDMNYNNKKIFSFIRFYNKKIKKEKSISRILILFTAIIAAMATLFINFGNTFTSEQKNFVNSISQNTLFVVNDTLGLNLKLDIEGEASFTDGETNKIKSIPNIVNTYPFYEFKSYGAIKDGGKNDITQGKISLKDDNLKTIKQISYNDQNQTNRFSIEPLYSQDNVDNFLQNKNSENAKNGFILTDKMAKDLSSDPKSLIGKTLEVTCYVPIKIYDIKATRPTENNKSNTSTQSIKSNDTYCKVINISEKITGVLSSSYDNQRSEEEYNLIYMDYDKMKDIIDKNKDTDYSKPIVGCPEHELAPTAMIVTANSFENVPIITNKLQNISPAFEVVSKAADIHKIEDNLDMIKVIMQCVSAILVIIVMIMFGFVYFFKNRTRKKEVGILKAIGLTTRNVILVIAYEMVAIALKTFIIAICFSVALMILGNAIFATKLFVLDATSILFCFVLSFIIVVVSGVFSIWKTSRIDIIDAIRNNK